MVHMEVPSGGNFVLNGLPVTKLEPTMNRKGSSDNLNGFSFHYRGPLVRTMCSGI